MTFLSLSLPLQTPSSPSPSTRPTRPSSPRAAATTVPSCFRLEKRERQKAGNLRSFHPILIHSHLSFHQVGSSDGTAELTGHTDTVCSVGFSADGTLLATGGLDGTVRVWDVATAAPLRTLDGPADGLEWVAWHPRGHVLLAGSDDFCAWMWNADTGATMGVLAGHAGAVRCGAWTADGKAAVTGGGEGDGSLRAWDPKSAACTATLSGHGFHEGAVIALAVAGPDTPTVVLTGGEDGTARLSNVANGGRVVATLDPAAHTDSVEAVAFGPPSLPLLATAGMDGKLILWDSGSLAPRVVCEHGQDGVTCLAFAPLAAGTPLVATGGLDGIVRAWDARTGECVRAWTGHAKGVQAVAWSPDGGLLLSGSDDGTAKVWELRG